MSKEVTGLKGKDQNGKKCLTPGCKGRYGVKGTRKGASGGRGLCHSCHQSAINLVRKGKTTWEELENLKLATPTYRSKLEEALHRRRSIKETKEGNSNPNVHQE